MLTTKNEYAYAPFPSNVSPCCIATQHEMEGGASPFQMATINKRKKKKNRNVKKEKKAKDARKPETAGISCLELCVEHYKLESEKRRLTTKVADLKKPDKKCPLPAGFESLGYVTFKHKKQVVYKTFEETFQKIPGDHNKIISLGNSKDNSITLEQIKRQYQAIYPYVNKLVDFLLGSANVNHQDKSSVLNESMIRIFRYPSGSPLKQHCDSVQENYGPTFAWGIGPKFTMWDMVPFHELAMNSDDPKSPVRIEIPSGHACKMSGDSRNLYTHGFPEGWTGPPRFSLILRIYGKTYHRLYRNK